MLAHSSIASVTLVMVTILFSLFSLTGNVAFSYEKITSFNNLSKDPLLVMMQTNAKGSRVLSINNSVQNATNNPPIRVILENDLNPNFIYTTLIASVLAGALAGTFTGIAIVRSDEYLHGKRKPVLSLDKFQITTRDFAINAYEINEPTVPSFLRFFPLTYVANRVTVLNSGSGRKNLKEHSGLGRLRFRKLRKQR
jgi:hypothetical protein